MSITPLEDAHMAGVQVLLRSALPGYQPNMMKLVKTKCLKCSFVLTEDEMVCGALVGDDAGYIFCIAVKPFMRSQGHGSELLQHYKRHLSGRVSFLTLHAQSQSSDLHSFYQRNGFTKSRLVPDYYRRLADKDAYEFSCDIGSAKRRKVSKKEA
eukprot:TRINITY_DN1809_c0_g1_i1.p1 TRINITY_DN1809_c0_g1~~TRINITY_DN1809_c0_g1_i1.p1  ORF type:complete len:154 (+),score=19.70 TRINITY_DN1809_c0_g1_i1:60-521(+)